MEQWIKFMGIAQPYFDRKGIELPTATRQIIYARNPRDLIYGGGYVWPDLAEFKVLKRYQVGRDLLVKIDAKAKEITDLIMLDKEVEVVATHKVDVSQNKKSKHLTVKTKTIQFKDFTAILVTPEQAEALLKAWDTYKDEKSLSS